MKSQEDIEKINDYLSGENDDWGDLPHDEEGTW